jgi:aminoglycoside/choline kinase family phosphotransferase
MPVLTNHARKFLADSGWGNAACELITGDASTRVYFRLRQNSQTAILMDASRLQKTVAPFILIDRHLRQLGFSAPDILASNNDHGLLLLEDFGETTFAQPLDEGADPEKLFTLATDVLIALHKHPHAVPKNLRPYSIELMLSDLELFLDWGVAGISDKGKSEFRKAWRETLPAAHQTPDSLLLRDYHVANLMLLPNHEGVRQAGLLDFQDAYRGPIAYDLISLLEDARRDVPETLRQQLLARYLAQFPDLDRDVFATSAAILAALRHTRILAIFERLSKRDEKPKYKQLHWSRVERLLQQALQHPVLAAVERWFDQYAR